MAFRLCCIKAGMISAISNSILVATGGLAHLGVPLCQGGEVVEKKADRGDASEGRREVLVLTFPKNADRKNCFPKQFVRASVSGSQIRLVDCEKNSDREVAVTDNCIIISLNGKYGFCNSRGVVIVEPKFDFMESFSGGRAVVRIDRKYGYVNTRGHFAIRPKFDWAYSFYDGVGAVRLGGLWGLIDGNGTWKKKPSFRRIDLLKGGLYAVTTDGKKGFIDGSGNFVNGVLDQRNLTTEQAEKRIPNNEGKSSRAIAP
jgi:hypothetical protein